MNQAKQTSAPPQKDCGKCGRLTKIEEWFEEDTVLGKCLAWKCPDCGNGMASVRPDLTTEAGWNFAKNCKGLFNALRDGE